MNGFAALYMFIAAFSPSLGELPLTPPWEIAESADELNQLQLQDQRMDGPVIQGVIYFDGPLSGGSQKILR